MALDVEVYPKMLRKKSKAVPEGNDPIPQDACVMQGGITPEEIRRVMSETMGNALEEFKEGMRRVNQRLVSLEQDARQARFAMKADVTANKKTRERTEVAVAAVQVKYGDSCSAKKAQAGPTSFGVKAEPPAIPRRDDVLVDNGAAVPKSCVSPLEIHTPTAAGGLLLASKPSTTTKITYNQPRHRICPTKETNSKRTSVQYASYYSSFWRNNQLAARLQYLRSDQGTEDTNRNFKEYYCKRTGVIQQFTAPYAPQQNIISERTGRT